MKKILSPEPKISPLFLKNISLTSNTVDDAARFRQHADDVIAQWRERRQIQTALNAQGHRYKVHYQLVSGTQQICSIQLDPVQPNHSGFRLDYSPAKVSAKTRELLQQHLNALFLTDYGEVMRNARIVALELAVDISNVSFANLLIAEKRKRSSSLYGQFMDQGGNIEKIHLGAERSDGQIRIFDHTKAPDDVEGKDTKVPGILRTRVEATLIPRIKAPISTPPSSTPNATGAVNGTLDGKSKLRAGIYLRELDLLRNPFDRVQLFSLSAADTLRNDYRWQIFLRCCERIGAQAALPLLPDKKRCIYLNRFSQGRFAGGSQTIYGKACVLRSTIWVSSRNRRSRICKLTMPLSLSTSATHPCRHAIDKIDKTNGHGRCGSAPLTVGTTNPSRKKTQNNFVLGHLRPGGGGEYPGRRPIMGMLTVCCCALFPVKRKKGYGFCAAKPVQQRWPAVSIAGPAAIGIVLRNPTKGTGIRIWTGCRRLDVRTVRFNSENAD